MTHFVKHHPCPKCGSSDAYAEYSDGGYWCFSCQKGKRPESSLETVKKYFHKEGTISKGMEPLPYDVTDNITGEPLAWLRKYNLTPEELFNNNILWSESRQMLIMPYYADGNLLCWQGRFVPTRKPYKTHTEGKPEEHLLLHYSGSPDSAVCVVEDTISGIKVSRVMTSCVLWGSNLSNQKAQLLSKYFDHLVLWLDGDKTREAMKFYTRYGWMFKSARVISTDRDPKEHTTKEILDLLS
jgi:hypothetical protein